MNDVQFAAREELLTDIHPEGCRFGVENRTEHFRTLRYGGELEFSKMVVAAMGQNDVLYDIGANVGIVAIHAAMKGGTVYAFEPDPYYSARLANNVALNQLQNVEIKNWAIGNEPGITDLYTDGDGGNSPCMRQLGRKEIIQVKLASVDTALAKGRLSPASLIKMDIEGAEHLALQGMKGLLNSPHAPRAVFIEIHPVFLELFNSTSEDVFTLLHDCGYGCVYQCRRSDQIHAVFWHDVSLSSTVGHISAGEKTSALPDEMILKELWPHALYLKVSKAEFSHLVERYKGKPEDLLTALLPLSARCQISNLLVMGDFESSQVFSWQHLAAHSGRMTITKHCQPSKNSTTEILGENGSYEVISPEDILSEIAQKHSHAMVILDVSDPRYTNNEQWNLNQIIDSIVEHGLLVLRNYVFGDSPELDTLMDEMTAPGQHLKAVGTSWRTAVFRRINSPTHGAIFPDLVVLP